MVTGFQRSTRYQLMPGPPGPPGTPRFLACHEYESAGYSTEQIKKVVGTEWSKKILGAAKSFDRDVWEEIGYYGIKNGKL
jgi:hypothetical protein